MKSKIFFVVLLVAVVLGTSAATPPPTVQTVAETPLFSGPSSVGYQVIATLPAGTNLFPVATFGDFVSVETIVGTVQKGYVPKALVTELPASLKELAFDAVPWFQLVDGAALSNWTKYYADSITLGKVGFVFDNSKSQNWVNYGNYASPIFATGIPVRFDFEYSGTGISYGVTIWGRPMPGPQNWWVNTRIDVVTEGANVSLLYYDGTSPNFQRITLPKGLAGQPLSLGFDAPGTTVTVTDGKGKVVKTVSLSQPMFPDGTMFFGIIVAPGAVLNVSKFTVTFPPSGKYYEPPKITNAQFQDIGPQELYVTVDTFFGEGYGGPGTLFYPGQTAWLSAGAIFDDGLAPAEGNTGRIGTTSEPVPEGIGSVTLKLHFGPWTGPGEFTTTAVQVCMGYPRQKPFLCQTFPYSKTWQK